MGPAAQAPIGKRRWGRGGEGARGTSGGGNRRNLKLPAHVGAVRRNHPGQSSGGVALAGRGGETCPWTARLLQAAPRSNIRGEGSVPGTGVPSLRSQRPQSPPARRGSASGAGAGAQRTGGWRCGFGAGTEPASQTRLLPLPARPPRVVSPESQEETELSGSTALGPHSSDRAEPSRLATPEHRPRPSPAAFVWEP